MNRLRPLILLLCWLFFITGTVLPSKAAPPPSSRKIIVAAKPFTESYILSEMLAQIIDAEGEATAVRKFGLGGPTLVVDGLKAGELDLDVSYTGALSHLFLPQTPNPSRAELLTALRSHGLLLSESLGFNNTYAIAVRTAMAQTLRLANISDLIPHHTLRGAFTPDFLNYDDGFYKLQQVYGVALQSIKPMQHSLAYQALQSREIDLTDAYTTDGALPQFELTLLKDDRGFFPTYFAVILIRAEIAERFPKTWQALRKLEGQLSETQMTAVNAQVDVHKREVSAVAHEFLVQRALIGNPRPPTRGAVLDEGLWIATAEHLYLVLSALLLSCLLGIPLGIVAVQFRRTGQVLIAVTSLLQTIPSLALLCFLIPIMGIGAMPTIFALFLYGLLPVAQSTTAGLLSLDSRLIETAKILGLTRLQRLRLIELPMASLYILSGIKTTAVINVATATIAALIGAGGYGRFITSGLAMNDVRVILKGAIPTALMAILFHALFEQLSRWLVPKGLQTEPARSP
jgi:osmoprotectant transport system permease protein